MFRYRRYCRLRPDMCVVIMVDDERIFHPTAPERYWPGCSGWANIEEIEAALREVPRRLATIDDILWAIPEALWQLDWKGVLGVEPK